MINSFLWSFIIAITAFNIMWLEMRVNIGLLFFVCWLLFFCLSSLLTAKRNWNWGFRFSLINLLVCLVYSVIALGFSRLSVVPAIIIREGLGMTKVSFSTINIFMSLLIIASFILLFVVEKRRKKRQFL